MLPEISLLGRLEALDDNTHKLQARLLELPKLLASHKKIVEDRQKALEARRAALTANEAERRQLENAVAQHQSKLAKLKKQIDQAATEAQVQAFEHEIAFATNAISTAEDRILFLLEEAETLAAENSATEKDLASARNAAASAFRSAEQEHKAGQQTLAANAQQHKELHTQLPASIALLYDKLRKRYKTGPIIAEAEAGLCGVCQIEMRLANWQKMQAEPNALYLCEECGRPIVYNPAIKPVEG